MQVNNSQQFLIIISKQRDPSMYMYMLFIYICIDTLYNMIPVQQENVSEYLVITKLCSKNFCHYFPSIMPIWERPETKHVAVRYGFCTAIYLKTY